MSTVPTTYYTTVQKVSSFLGSFSSQRAVPVAGTPRTTGNESVGTGDGSTTKFYLGNYNVIPSSEQIYVSGVLKTITTDYTLDADAGTITFVVAPILSAAVTANYDFHEQIAPSLLGTLINRAEAEIDSKIGRSFMTTASVTETVDGTVPGSSSFYNYNNALADSANDLLPTLEAIQPPDQSQYVGRTIKTRYWPILTVTAISISGTALSASDYNIYGSQGVIIIDDSSGKFFTQGTQNISVAYTYGYATVPTQIEDLCTRMAARSALETLVMGSPGQKLDTLSRKIRALDQDIERIIGEYGSKLELTGV